MAESNRRRMAGSGVSKKSGYKEEEMTRKAGYNNRKRNEIGKAAKHRNRSIWR
jgi:hypothetical protein